MITVGLFKDYVSQTRKPEGFLGMFDSVTWIQGSAAELRDDLRGVVMFTEPHQ